MYTDNYHSFDGLNYFGFNYTSQTGYGTQYFHTNPSAVSHFYRTDTRFDKRGRLSRTQRPTARSIAQFTTD